MSTTKGNLTYVSLSSKTVLCPRPSFILLSQKEGEQVQTLYVTSLFFFFFCKASHLLQGN